MDEQRVRTEAGWVGVEISKSRVRAPGKPGFGLYRMRLAPYRTTERDGHPSVTAGEWTPYAFTLEQIAEGVRGAIEQGTPAGPYWIRIPHPNQQPGRDWPDTVVATRWTQAYRGRRDLGVSVPATLSREFAAELDALAPLVDEGLIQMQHVEGCACSRTGTDSLTAVCAQRTLEVARPSTEQLVREYRVVPGRSLGEVTHDATGCDRGGEPHLGPCMTAKQRQREWNARFQRQHAEARSHGLEARHAAKLAARPPAERHADDSGPV
jgi:hypothetical protein